MAAPAYRTYGTSARQTAPRTTQRPAIHVVPGRRGETGVSPRFIAASKLFFVAVLVLSVFALGRVALSAAAIDTAMASEEIEAQIDTARSEGNSLSVQEGYLSNPMHVRTIAASQLKMGEAAESTVLNVSDDVVKTDAEGNLSLSQSLTAAATQG